MKLSRTVSYALQATLQLARRSGDAPVPCSQLAAAGHMPERFLLQILRNLVTHGILQSTRGVDGGYRLERPAEKITLLDLIEAIDGPVVAGLPVSDGLDPASEAKLREALADVAERARHELASITVAQLLPPLAIKGAPTTSTEPQPQDDPATPPMGTTAARVVRP